MNVVSHVIEFVRVVLPERHRKLTMDDDIDNFIEGPKFASNFLDQLSDSQVYSSGMSIAVGDYGSSIFFIGDAIEVIEDDLI